MTIPTIPLSDGGSIPALGLGTYGLRGEAGISSLRSALDIGYRLLDTAQNYDTETEVGAAVRATDVPREEIVVTTKLRGRNHGYAEALAGFDESRSALGLDYVDLLLIHWPLPRVNKFVDTWRAMIELREQGLVRAIGVSNFTEEHIVRLLAETGVAPAINQIELHPRFGQERMRAFNTEHGILTESWSPLGDRGELRNDSTVIGVAEAHGVTPTQAVLRWHVQLGAIPIPKSADAARQRENIDVFGFELSDKEMSAISSLESGRLWDGDPGTHEEF